METEAMEEKQRKHNLVKPVSERVEWKRDEKTCIVELDVIPMMVALPAGLVAEKGVRRYLVPRSVVPLLLSQVRTDQDRADLQTATERYERARQRFVDTDVAVMKFRERGETDEESKRIKELQDKYGGSPEATFQQEFERPLLPFNRVTVIEDHLTNPADEIRITQENELIERERQARAGEVAAMSAMVAKAVSEALQPSAAGAGGAETIAAAVAAAMAPVVDKLAQVIAQNQTGASKKGA